MDDNAAKLGRQKMRSDAMKRQFAVHGTAYRVQAEYVYVYVVLCQIINAPNRCSPHARSAMEKMIPCQKLRLLQWARGLISRAQRMKSLSRVTV
jgi:hypothetical protein